MLGAGELVSLHPLGWLLLISSGWYVIFKGWGQFRGWAGSGAFWQVGCQAIPSGGWLFGVSSSGSAGQAWILAVWVDELGAGWLVVFHRVFRLLLHRLG